MKLILDNKLNKPVKGVVIKSIEVYDFVQGLRKARINTDMSQTDIAKKLNLKKSYISRIENGNSDFRLSTLIRYLDSINCDLKIIPKNYVK